MRMNVHSRGESGVLQAHPDPTDRQARILDAAERCFVRSGFHRTTMQDVAQESGMSAGNLYRYFPSKDAIVAGLTERDRREAAETFAAMQSAGGDFMTAFAALGRRHFEDEPREKAVLCLEIWSEATRNPHFGRLTSDCAADVIGRLSQLLDGAKAAGTIAPALDSRTVATLICTMGDGLVVRRAVHPDFDPAREVAAVMHVIAALVSGQVSALDRVPALDRVSAPSPSPEEVPS